MRRTKEDALITRKLIIETAVTLFLEKGFSDTRLEEIAAKADVTRGAIYWHFKGKLDIIYELIETEMTQFSSQLQSIFQQPGDPFRKMEVMIEAIVDKFYGNGSFRNFIELTWFKIEYTQLARLRSSKAELTQYFLEKFRDLVSEAQRSGVITDEIRPHDIAITITHMVNGMYRLYFILPEAIQDKGEAMRSFNSYLTLIKNKTL